MLRALRTHTPHAPLSRLMHTAPTRCADTFSSVSAPRGLARVRSALRGPGALALREAGACPLALCCTKDGLCGVDRWSHRLCVCGVASVR
eukprot:5853918-Pleurochrysis_carterae.AAC.2